MAEGQAFDRVMLEGALRELGRRAHAAGKVIEIAIYGGCAVMLTLNYRVATKDVDAVFEKDKEFVRRLATEMAEEFGWDNNWLNDGVKGFLSTAESDPKAKLLVGTYPSEEEPGLLRYEVPRDAHWRHRAKSGHRGYQGACGSDRPEKCSRGNGPCPGVLPTPHHRAKDPVRSRRDFFQAER